MAAKQMLGGGEQNTLFHEARGVADASRRFVPLRFDREIVKVHAAEHDCRCRLGQVPRRTCPYTPVWRAHTLGKGLISNGCLEH